MELLLPEMAFEVGSAPRYSVSWSPRLWKENVLFLLVFLHGAVEELLYEIQLCDQFAFGEDDDDGAFQTHLGL